MGEGVPDHSKKFKANKGVRQKYNMRNLFCTKTELLEWYKTTSKMMFPIRNDVTLDCETTLVRDTPCRAKFFKNLIFFLLLGAIIVFLLSIFFRGEVQEGTEEATEETQKCSLEINDNIKQELKSWIQKEVQSNAKICGKNTRINSEQMREIIKEELKVLHKNQIKPDFASASAGGMILEASPTWTEGYSYIYFLFIPIKSMAPPPSIILEPTREAGDCWPMSGQKGKVLVQLAARASILGFTVEHIDPAMSLSGGTPEAPNNFSVYGIESLDSRDTRHLFGTYIYDNTIENENQYFRVQNINRKSFLYIELEITSNHGNEKYTCLYRFQVHGFIDRAYHCQV